MRQRSLCRHVSPLNVYFDRIMKIMAARPERALFIWWLIALLDELRTQSADYRRMKEAACCVVKKLLQQHLRPKQIIIPKLYTAICTCVRDVLVKWWQKMSVRALCVTELLIIYPLRKPVLCQYQSSCPSWLLAFNGSVDHGLLFHPPSSNPAKRLSRHAWQFTQQ